MEWAASIETVGQLFGFLERSLQRMKLLAFEWRWIEGMEQDENLPVASLGTKREILLEQKAGTHAKALSPRKANRF